jgi:uncharacterized membrane protein
MCNQGGQAKFICLILIFLEFVEIFFPLLGLLLVSISLKNIKRRLSQDFSTFLSLTSLSDSILFGSGTFLVEVIYLLINTMEYLGC